LDAIKVKGLYSKEVGKQEKFMGKDPVFGTTETTKFKVDILDNIMRVINKGMDSILIPQE
jgi:hypothetical protein